MLRKQTRLRQEYLFRKANETQERQIFEKKQAIKQALQEGKPLPTELRKETQQIRKDLPYDEAQTELESHVDDEYARAGVSDPKVVVTTSRDPSSRLAQFAKEMRLVIPGSQRINRGNYVMKDLVGACRSNDVTDLVILHEHRGQPDGMIISHFPYGPTLHLTLYNVVLRHDIKDQGTVSEANPHLIFEHFVSSLGSRVMNIIKHLFPVPRPDSKRVMTFVNEGDFISFRHHVFYKTGQKDVQLAEVGPRFEMRAYEIKLGTVDITDADTEWVLRPYHRTAKKRQVL